MPSSPSLSAGPNFPGCSSSLTIRACNLLFLLLKLQLFLLFVTISVRAKVEYLKAPVKTTCKSNKHVAIITYILSNNSLASQMLDDAYVSYLFHDDDDDTI